MNQLLCTDRNGNLTTFFFKSERDETRREINYKVYADPLPVSGEFFELSVKDLGNELQVIAMFNHKEPAYKEKGIPDALLLHIAEFFKKSVRSRPKSAPNGDYRTADATKVWDRLVKKNIASYFPDEDIYRIP